MARSGWSCEAATQALGLSGPTTFTQKVLPVFETIAREMAADPLKTMVNIMPAWVATDDAMVMPPLTARGWLGGDLARLGIDRQRHGAHHRKFAKLVAADPLRSWLDVLLEMDALRQEWFQAVCLERLETRAAGREPLTAADFDRRYRRLTDCHPAYHPAR